MALQFFTRNNLKHQVIADLHSLIKANPYTNYMLVRDYLDSNTGLRRIVMKRYGKPDEAKWRDRYRTVIYTLIEMVIPESKLSKIHNKRSELVIKFSEEFEDFFNVKLNEDGRYMLYDMTCRFKKKTIEKAFNIAILHYNDAKEAFSKWGGICYNLEKEYFEKLDDDNLVDNTSNKLTSPNAKVWIDTDTNLMWQVKIDYDIADCNWDEATEYALKLNRKKYGGFRDWRIPSKNELESLLTKNKYKNKYYIQAPLFESMNGWSGGFWTSSEFSNTKAWRVGFGHGYSFRDDKTRSFYVRCVRDNY